MRVGSLFSGIGGFDLGFERAGMTTEFFVEQAPFCQAVLRKHWPDVPIFGDIQTVDASMLPPVDLLCGGFPCQDISPAGQGAGLDGKRSGLWAEFHRLIGEIRPRYVVVENVPMLRSRGLGRILREMAALGYDAEWDCIPASAVGAPHRRDRIWIVGSEVVANADSKRRQHLQESKTRRGLNGSGQLTNPSVSPAGVPEWPTTEQWATEPDVGRVAYGVPARVDRLRALGNALIPQIAEEIGWRIMRHELCISRQ
jgi:DNA (cytosine-5)-methyltransferase 1